MYLLLALGKAKTSAGDEETPSNLPKDNLLEISSQSRCIELLSESDQRPFLSPQT